MPLRHLMYCASTSSAYWVTDKTFECRTESNQRCHWDTCCIFASSASAYWVIYKTRVVEGIQAEVPLKRLMYHASAYWLIDKTWAVEGIWTEVLLRCLMYCGRKCCRLVTSIKAHVVFWTHSFTHPLLTTGWLLSLHSGLIRLHIFFTVRQTGLIYSLVPFFSSFSR